MPYKDPARKRENDRLYREAHREERRMYNRLYAATHKDEKRERERQYRIAHPEKMRGYRRKWIAAHPEYFREASRRFYAAHRAEVCARTLRWQTANPDKVCAIKHKRRALKSGNGGSFTEAEWKTLCAQYNNQCIGPGPHGGKLTRDHIIPVGEPGGTSNIDNIQPLCQSCNSRKGNRTIDFRRDRQ